MTPVTCRRARHRRQLAHWPPRAHPARLSSRRIDSSGTCSDEDVGRRHQLGQDAGLGRRLCLRLDVLYVRSLSLSPALIQPVALTRDHTHSYSEMCLWIILFHAFNPRRLPWCVAPSLAAPLRLLTCFLHPRNQASLHPLRLGRATGHRRPPLGRARQGRRGARERLGIAPSPVDLGPRECLRHRREVFKPG